MNYGKSAYLKVIELEKRMTDDSRQNDEFVKFLELDKTNMNTSVYSNVAATIPFKSLSLEEGKQICFQIKIRLTSIKQDTLSTSIVLGQNVIHQESIKLSSNDNEIMVMKTFLPIASSAEEFALKFKINDSQNMVTIDDIKVIIIGMKQSIEEGEFEVKALKLFSSVLISYIDSYRLYYQVCPLVASEILSDNFTFVREAKCHSFFAPSNESNYQNAKLVYTDLQNNLYYSTPFISEERTKIDTNVEDVSGIFLGDNNESIIVYVKQGEIYFVSLADGKFTTPKKLNFPKILFKKVTVICRENIVHIIAIAGDGSTYLLSSLGESDIHKAIENLSATYNIAVARYIDISNFDSKMIESLKMSPTALISPYIIFDKLIEQQSVSRLKLSINALSEAYEQPTSIVYGVKLDKQNPIGATWATYTDDAEGFEGAYMDFASNQFVDKGWYDRWPFNQIKPCLVSPTWEISYLDKNDYSKFEDGTPANIYAKESGRVMVEFPKIYYKITCDERYNYIQISDSMHEGYCCFAHTYEGQELDHVYVDAYTSPMTGFKTLGLDCYSGMSVDTQTATALNNTYPLIAYYYPKNVQFMTYSLHTLICALFSIMFCSTDVRHSLGVGLKEKPTSYTTGATDTLGLCYGSSEASHIKLFGLEDYYGMGYNYTLGLYYRSTGNLTYVPVQDPDSSYSNKKINSLPEVEGEYSLSVATPCNAIEINGRNDLGFIATANNSVVDQTTGFCDPSSVNSNCVMIAYGNVNPSLGGGLFGITSITANSIRPVSFRAVYFPKEEENEI